MRQAICYDRRMKVGDLDPYERLRDLLRRRQELAWDAVDSLGLLLPSRLRPSDYRQTPAGCIPFAFTGGDGVHFSFADTGDGISCACPVVMTAPMNFDAPNLVVGANLREFLALGLRTGYFVLAELLYDREKWIGILATQNWMPGLRPEEIGTLKAIEAEFDISPWTDPGTRLARLNADHSRLLAAASGSV